MFEIIKNKTKIDFIGYAKFYFAFSIMVCLASLYFIFFQGFNYGVDFSGGTVVQVRFEKAPEIDNIRSVVDKSVKGKVSIQNFGEENDFLIKAEESGEDLQVVADSIQSSLKNNFKDSGEITIMRIEQVGPQVGKDLKYQALLAVLYAVVGILIYVAIRFEILSAFGSIVALLHDIIITLGAIVVAGITFDLTVLAAVLTVVGYSLNDKIVVFDRIREKMRSDGDKPIGEIMNLSINETLSRTILTSFSTLLAVLALFIFGGEVIKGFAFTMLVGIIVGTYSSIGIASAVVYYLREMLGIRNKKRAKK